MTVSKLALRIPPPIIALLCGGVIWGASIYAPAFAAHVPGQRFFAFAFVAAGLVLDGVSVAKFLKEKTTISPLSPSKTRTIVETGFYRFSRNPMYLGMAFILIGIGLFCGSVTALPVLLLFIWYMTTFQIKPEEAQLTRTFGDAFLTYKKRVRRWL